MSESLMSETPSSSTNQKLGSMIILSLLVGLGSYSLTRHLMGGKKPQRKASDGGLAEPRTPGSVVRRERSVKK